MFEKWVNIASLSTPPSTDLFNIDTRNCFAEMKRGRCIDDRCHRSPGKQERSFLSFACRDMRPERDVVSVTRIPENHCHESLFHHDCIKCTSSARGGVEESFQSGILSTFVSSHERARNEHVELSPMLLLPMANNSNSFHYLNLFIILIDNVIEFIE